MMIVMIVDVSVDELCGLTIESCIDMNCNGIVFMRR